MASWARLSERVENQGKDLSDLRSNMNTGFQQLNAAINTLSNEVRGGSKTQWPIIIGFSSVTITILAGLGFLALQPIKDNIAQIREDAKVQTASTSTAIATLVDKMVSKDEMQWRTQRGIEDRQRTDSAVKDLRDAQVPRAELDRVFAAYDQRFLDQQRQLSDMKESQGSVYGARDVIMDLKTNQQRLERELSDMKSRAGGS